MTVPFAPVIHSDPSLANGSGHGLDKAVIVCSGKNAILVEFGTAVGGIQESRLALLLSDGFVEVIEPLAGSEAEGIPIEPFEGWRGVLGDVGGGVLLTIGTGKNTREILEKDIHVGGLIRIHDGTTGRAKSFGEDVEIGPEGGAPLSRLLNQEGRDDFRAGGAFATTITGHGLTRLWVFRHGVRSQTGLKVADRKPYNLSLLGFFGDRCFAFLVVSITPTRARIPRRSHSLPHSGPLS